MDKQDEKQIREIAREEALKCIREENARFTTIKVLLVDTKKKKNTKA